MRTSHHPVMTYEKIKNTYRDDELIIFMSNMQISIFFFYRIQLYPKVGYYAYKFLFLRRVAARF